MTTEVLPDNAEYDYIIVGGGTAGCVIASRLSAYLPDSKILMIEAGPSDFNLNHVLQLREWMGLLGSDLDYDYVTTEQPMGNSAIRHSRAKVLGGCSSHNTLISFRPMKYDMDRWVQQGCKGWDFDTMMRLCNKLRNTVQPVHARHRNQLCEDWITACSAALDLQVVPDFNKEIATTGQLSEAVGFLSISYNPDDGKRSSASVAYIHPILNGTESRPNLTILTEAWASKLYVKNDEVTGIDVTLKGSKSPRRLKAKKEIVICAGAVDTPRLLLLSGLGPKEQLKNLGIPVIKDIPGVGENLLDHPETVMIWELNKPVPPETTMNSDAAFFMRHEPANSAGNDGNVADIMMHCYQIPFTVNTEPLGYPKVRDRYAFCMTPNVPRPRSRGRLFLTSADPSVKPALDFRYFTDAEGYDAATLVAALKASRKCAEQEPFKSWIKKEVAPGPKVQTDEEISEFARRAAHTVYHISGTTKMGDVKNDPMAVVDTNLKVRGLRNLRIADAGVFPEITSVNPMLTVLAIGERCAELMAEANWGPAGRM